MPTPTRTPTATPGANRIQGDVDCSGVIDSTDFGELLRFAADLFGGQHGAPCLDLGELDNIAGFHWGDVNCDHDVNTIDSLFVLAHTASIDLPQAAGNCFPLGEGET